MNEVLSGEKPLLFEITVNSRTALILGLTIFLAVVVAYFTVKSFAKA